MDSIKMERIRAVLVIVVTAIVNVINVYGYAVDADAVVNVVTSILSAIAIVYAWWKNNNVTKEAVAAQAYLRKLKGAEDDKEG